MIVLYQILAFLIVFGIIVLVHEFGHYVAARLTGVRVETFSFGFGKRIVGKKIGDTDFRLSIIPLGGFVKMAGEDEYDPENLKPDEFQHKNRAQKIFILVMGPLMNIVLAFLILTMININGVDTEKYKLDPPKLWVIKEGSPAEKAGLEAGDLVLTVDGKKISNWKGLEMAIGANPNEELSVEFERKGRKNRTTLKVESISQYSVGYAGFYWDHKTEIGAVEKDSPALAAGLKKGDVVLAIDRKPVHFLEIADIISGSPDKPLLFKVQRDGVVKDLRITPRRMEDEVKIGIEMAPYAPTIRVRYGFFKAVKKSVDELVNLTSLTFNAFKKMIVGKLSPKNLSGPIEIARFSQRALESGFSNFFMLIAFISLQLGIINLFPIPALDGGHLMIYSIEAVVRREFSQRAKAILINTGFFILISLMVFVILNDVAKTLPNGWDSLIPF